MTPLLSTNSWKKNEFNFDHFQMEERGISDLNVTRGYPTNVITKDGKIIYCGHGGFGKSSQYYKVGMDLFLKRFSDLIQGALEK